MVKLNVVIAKKDNEELVGSFLMNLPENVTNSGIDLAVLAGAMGYCQGRGIPFEDVGDMLAEVEVLEDNRKDPMEILLGMFQDAALRMVEPAGEA